MITIKCPSCNNELQCDDSYRGTVVKCSICQSEFQVPNSQPAPAESQAPLRLAAEPTPPPMKKITTFERPISSSRSSDGNRLAGTAIFLSIVAIIAVVASSVFFWFRTEPLKKPSFYSDVEKAAKAQFERWLAFQSLDNDQEGYVCSKSKSEALEHFDMDVEEKGDYALVLWTTKVQGEKIYGHYWFKENKNGVYVLTNKYRLMEEKMSDSEREWFAKMEKQIQKHENNDKGKPKFKWEDIKVKE